MSMINDLTDKINASAALLFSLINVTLNLLAIHPNPSWPGMFFTDPTNEALVYKSVWQGVLSTNDRIIFSRISNTYSSHQPKQTLHLECQLRIVIIRVPWIFSFRCFHFHYSAESELIWWWKLANYTFHNYIATKSKLKSKLFHPPLPRYWKLIL